MRSKVQRVAPPAHSALAGWYADADLLDSYAVCYERQGNTMHGVAQLMLGKPSRAAAALMHIRDSIMGPLRVKTAKSLRDAKGDDSHIDFFRVIAEYPDEIILGEDDRHLDFRLSLQCRNGASGPEIAATTAVHIHNNLGRLYILAIRPFHVLIMRSMLRRLSQTQIRRFD